MIVIGGRTINSQGTLPIEVYDTEKSESYEFPGLGLYRQSSFIFDDGLYIYGGFNDKNPFLPLGNISKINLFNLFDASPLIKLYIEITQDMNDNNNSYSNSLNHNNNSLSYNQGHLTKINQKELTNKKDSKYKLAHEVVIGAGQIEENVEEASILFRKISIDKLPEENKRIGQEKLISSLQSRRVFNYDLINKFIEILLRPFDWYTPLVEEIHQSLPFTEEEIRGLLQEIKPVFEKESSLPRIRSPCKIFGNLFGEYNDLMRFFESYGNPSDDNQMGDIHVNQYLFLGDICDRGFYSLEIVFLLFALKVKYPEHIYIIRGHHEDIDVNISYGLGQECKDRLNDNISKPSSIFSQINSVFEYLPLGIVIDNQILCVHGGIGSSLMSLSDIENIKRPVKVIQEVSMQTQQLILDILWSEYSSDIDTLAVNEERDKSHNGFILKYGKERLNKFLNDNKLNLLVTSHQLVLGGIQTFNDDKLLTVFSATNYMDKYKNDGGMISIAKKTTNRPINIIPKLINSCVSKKECYRKNKSPSPVRNLINK